MDAVLALTAVAKVAIHSNVMIYLEFYQTQRWDALHKKGTFGKNATVGVGSDWVTTESALYAAIHTCCYWLDALF